MIMTLPGRGVGVSVAAAMDAGIEIRAWILVLGPALLPREEDVPSLHPEDVPEAEHDLSQPHVERGVEGEDQNAGHQHVQQGAEDGHENCAHGCPDPQAEAGPEVGALEVVVVGLLGAVVVQRSWSEASGNVSGDVVAISHSRLWGVVGAVVGFARGSLPVA